MRLRVERSLRKRFRRMRHERAGRALAQEVRRYERNGLPLGAALRTIVTDSAAGWLVRGDAARLLAISGAAAVSENLLKQFFSQVDEDELWETALTIERLGDVRSTGKLIHALNDSNHHRRHAAARALGWIPGASTRVVSALANALADISQSPDVREEAAESLAYLYSKRAFPALISALADAGVGIRFWAVFALGSIRDRHTFRHTNREVVPPLEAMLSDEAVPPGNWWSVAREALAMLGRLDPPEARHRDRLLLEMRRAIDDPNASPEDRRWAEHYRGSSFPHPSPSHRLTKQL